ncbi:MAG: zinc ribbon domain-containing protein, partial [Thermoleophilia bacterium]|nr:zinc ribbon domain-containing protein [Thermoleophilia bacterium]
MPFCTECGAQIYPDASFCISCGAPARFPESNVYVFALAEDADDPNYHIDFFEVELVGEAKHSEAFEEILGELDDEEEIELDDAIAVLVREPADASENEFVTVHVLDSESMYQQVGYLQANDVAEYLEVIRELERRTGRYVGCLARVHGKGKTAT